VLALVALFTGAFLVFSVLSLSVAKRAQQFALLGVLGLAGRERLRLVLLESGVLGLIGSALGVALGTALAALSLRILGGDLGGGYFSNVAPALRWSTGAALIYGVLGLAAALVGGWWPARQAQRLPPAQTLKGLGQTARTSNGHWLSLGLIALGVVLARAPAVFEIPLAAYVSVGLLLIGGITALPWLIALLLDRAKPLVTSRLLPLLALERARRVRESASVAVSGVVASLSLAVALTVMVASFRDSVTQWLNVVLPADLYVRTATSRSAGDTLFFTPEFVQAAAKVPGIQRISTQRTRQLQLDPARPAITLIARPLADPARNLPLVGEVLSAPSGSVAVFVSEAVVDLYGVRAGDSFPALTDALAPAKPTQHASFFVAGVLRDYAGQAGSITIKQEDYQRLTGDARVNDIALWLDQGAASATVQQALREVAGDKAGGLLEFASSLDIRALSLKIFDRSFAITYWLQAVAIGIGLFGVAASFSAQVLARRKEFGLLVHLGLTRRQILGVVAGEGLAWTAIGALAGLALGLAVSVILVHVVNPQSFHWTMDMAVPWPRLVLLCLAVVIAGTVTAWASARAAAGRDAVLAVKEDW
jgi:putative ABC transport system permease protein